MNRDARKKKTTPAVEKACLMRLKKKYNIVCDDYQAQASLDRKRKRKGGEDDLVEGAPKIKHPSTICPQYHAIFFDEDDNAAHSDVDDGIEPVIPEPSQSKLQFPPISFMLLVHCSLLFPAPPKLRLCSASLFTSIGSISSLLELPLL